MTLPRPVRLGLTGGIGSGKSTVAAMLVTAGAALVDTDAIARELTGPGGAAIAAITAAFGAPMIDAAGALDRAAMRALAFAEPDAKRRLEAILHPLIGRLALERAAAAASRGAPVIVFDVPLLTESSHWRERCDRILVVDCREDTQAARVAARPGWSEAAARAVIAQQASRARRRAIADAVIFNDGLTLDALHDEIVAVLGAWGIAAPNA